MQTRVRLLCRCGRVLDEFRVSEQPPGDASRFVGVGRTRPSPRSPEEAKGLQGLKAAGLGDYGPSRPHVDKLLVRGPGDPEPDWDEENEVELTVADASLPKSIVWYRCHPQRCGEGWYFWVRELADACFHAARAEHPEVRAGDLDHQGAASAYYQDSDERADAHLRKRGRGGIRAVLERILADAKEIETFSPADQRAEALQVLAWMKPSDKRTQAREARDPALGELRTQVVQAYEALLRRANAKRARDGAA